MQQLLHLKHEISKEYVATVVRSAVHLLHSPKLSVPTLCIKVAKSQAAQAAEFFTTIYDGEYDECPLGLNFLSFSTHNCATSDNDCSTLAQEQEWFLCSERTITIKGLHPFESKVHLATLGNPLVSIRSLLLLLPMANLVPLFHGIDHQHDPAVPFILANILNITPQIRLVLFLTWMPHLNFVFIQMITKRTLLTLKKNSPLVQNSKTTKTEKYAASLFTTHQKLPEHS